MIIVNIETIPGKNYEVLGMVKGSVVQSKHVGKDIMAGLKTIVGGEIKGYTEMMEEARKTATERMIEDAAKMKADAVLKVTYTSAMIMDGAAEIMAYGTAVRFL